MCRVCHARRSRGQSVWLLLADRAPLTPRLSTLSWPSPWLSFDERTGGNGGQKRQRQRIELCESVAVTMSVTDAVVHSHDEAELRRANFELF